MKESFSTAINEAFSPDEDGYYQPIIPPHNYQKWEQRREWQEKVIHYITLTAISFLLAAILFELVKALAGR